MMRLIVLASAAALAVLTAACDNQANDNAAAANADAAGNAATEVPVENAFVAVAPVGIAKVMVSQKAPFGMYLTDANGRSLYVLEGSKSAQGLQKCAAGCVDVWPPLFSDGAPQAGDRLDASKLSTVDRDGRQQVTYDGWPLYYYQADTSPGSTAGQDFRDQWGEWYLLSPEGKIVEAKG